MRWLNSVSFRGVQPQILLALIRADAISTGQGWGEIWITSCCDGKHMEGSKHYEGLAVDLRTRHLSPNDRLRFASLLARALGPEYDVVLEPTHLHVEYDPE